MSTENKDNNFLDKKYEKSLNKTDPLHSLFGITETLVLKFKPRFYNGSLYLRSIEDKKYTSNDRKIAKYINQEVSLTSKQFKEILYQLEIKSKHINKTIYTISLNNGVLTKNKDGHYEVVEDEGKFSPYNIDVKYDEDATSEVLDNFLDDISCGNTEVRKTLIEILGCVLIPDPKVQHMIFLQGPGGSGKTTFCEMIANFLGKDLVAHNSISDFKDQTKLSQLRGKLVNLSDDIDYEKLYIERTQILKILSSGGIISARAIYSYPVEFENTATIICSTNSMPILFNANSGIYRRLILLSLNKEFNKKKRDPDMLKKLSTPKVKSALLNLAIEGMNRLVDNNYTFTETKTLKETLDEYYTESDTVKAFLMEDSITDNVITNMTVNEVYEAYKTFCEVELSKEAVTKTLFGMRMKNYGYISKVRSVIHGKTKVSKRYYVKKKKSVSL